MTIKRGFFDCPSWIVYLRMTIAIAILNIVILSVSEVSIPRFVILSASEVSQINCSGFFDCPSWIVHLRMTIAIVMLIRYRLSY